MNTIEIKKLLREFDYPCLSITVPVSRTGDLEKDVNTTLLEADGLLNKLGLNATVLAQLERKIAQVDRTLEAEGGYGLGIYLSPRCSSVIALPFDVTNKIVIDHHFDQETLHQLEHYFEPPAAMA